MRFKVIDFINKNYNWREILTEKPYSIKIKDDGEFLLLKYDQLESDFNLEIVRECRGLIITFSEGKYIPVRAAFLKFGNYGEHYAADIDWDTAAVQEKVDGSLMSVWYYKGLWHISTNGAIDAFKAPLGDTGMTFGDYFFECLGDEDMFFLRLNHCYCYTFEMVGPLNHVVIPYNEPKLYAIGQRNMQTMEEVPYNGPLGVEYNIWLPQRYSLHNLDEVIKVTEHLSKDEEGFVVCDAKFNRIKVKSPEYLMAAPLHNNGVITIKRVVEMMREEQLDDFIAYCPQHEEMVNKVIGALKEMEEECAKEWEEVKEFAREEKKEFVSIVKDKGVKWPNYLYWKYSNSEGAPSQFFNNMTLKKITELIRRELDEEGN